MVETKRICNGTFGEVWLDGSYVGECYRHRVKLSLIKKRLNSVVHGGLITRLSAVLVKVPLPFTKSIPEWVSRLLR